MGKIPVNVMPPFIKSFPGRVLLCMILLVSVYSIANYFIIKLIVSPYHLQLERHLAQQEADHFTKLLVREEKTLATIAHAWAVREDICDFISTPDLGYISKKFSDNTLIEGGFNLLYFCRLDGSIAWGRVLDPKTNKRITLTELSVTDLKRNHPLLLHPEIDNTINGLIKTKHGPLLIASHPILTKENIESVVGTLMIGRYITKQFMVNAGKHSGTICRLIDDDDQDALSKIPVDLSSLSRNTPILFHDGIDRIAAYGLIYTFEGIPEWILEVQYERKITKQSHGIIKYILLLNISMGAGFVLLILFLYRHQLDTAISPFRGFIDRNVSPDFEKRRRSSFLRSFDTSEFARLGRDLRSMITKIEQDKEHQAGIIGSYAASLQELNTKLVEEIKERLRVENQLNETQETLEIRVRKRTYELQQANLTLHNEIEIRKEKEKDLQKHQNSLRALSVELMSLEEKQRHQLATDLHDKIGQSLSAVKMYVDGLVATTSDTSTLGNLQLIGTIIEETLKDIRTLTFELSPPVLYELGLAAALEWLAEDFYQKYDLRVSTSCKVCSQCTAPTLLSLLFRTIRELLVNVVRHAFTDSAEVTVQCRGKEVRVVVSDNGCGMKKKESAGEGFGLFSIRERINNMGGSVQIHSNKNNGTQVILIIPPEELCGRYGGEGR